MDTTDPRVFYARQGAMTDPGPYAHLFDALPHDPAELCTVVHGLMALNLWIDLGVLHVPEERKQEWNIRSVGRKLERILAVSDRPLTAARPFEQRLLGTCRDVSILLCSMLRHQGIAARIRVGFDTYDPEHLHDHWVCEYWPRQEERWVAVDVWLHQIMHQQERLDPGMRGALTSMGRNPLDLRPGEHILGGRAWQRCRAGEDDPMHYGIEGDLWGLWFIRDNMLRDLCALNRAEVLPWDCWGMVTHDRADPTPEEGAWFDHVAALTVAGDHAFAEIRALYDQTAGLQLPPGLALT